MWTVLVDVAYSFTQQNIAFMNLCPHVCCSNTIHHFPGKEAPSPDRFVPDWPEPELPELACLARAGLWLGGLDGQATIQKPRSPILGPGHSFMFRRPWAVGGWEGLVFHYLG